MTEREYKRSHPWLTFSLETGRFPHHFWSRLGECVSKCDHLKNTAMSGELRERLARVYLRKGAAATTAIEGNTLSEEQVGEIIAGNAPPPPQDYQPLHTQIVNVTALFDEIIDEAQRVPLPPLSPARLCGFQQKILANLDVDGNIGKIRERGVVVGGYRGAPCQDCDYLLEKLCRWLQEDPIFRQIEAEISATAAAILRATLAHLYIAWIHPFDDGNGRAARMAEFYLLVAGGIPAHAAHLLSNHCNNLRDEYYKHLNNATKTRSPAAFVGFLVGGLRNGLQEQLKYVYKEHEELVWNRVIKGKVAGSTSARKRRIKLAKLLLNKEPANATTLLRAPKIALLYAKTSGAALLQNDLEQLIRQGIAQKTEAGYAANKALLTALKPPTAKTGG